VCVKQITEEFDRFHPIPIARGLATHGGESLENDRLSYTINE